jgi:SCF-associated factor 1
VECGWAFSSVLTKTGDVFVFWPFKGDMLRRIAETNETFDNEGDKKVTITGSEYVIPCVTWDLQMDPVRLPALPPLPELHANEVDESDEDVILIQIAALDNNLIGLTNKGHVLKHDNLVDEASVLRGHWEYVSSFQ